MTTSSRSVAKRIIITHAVVQLFTAWCQVQGIPSNMRYEDGLMWVEPAESFKLEDLAEAIEECFDTVVDTEDVGEN